MGTGYTRNDVSNNISDGNTIDAADLDGEFNAIEDSFDSSTGHTHDGTTGEGGPISTLGPTADVTITSSNVSPRLDNTVDLGSSSLEYKDLYIDGTAHIDTLDVDENAAIAGNLTVTGTMSGAFSLLDVQTFTASGTYTPSTGAKYAVVEVFGAGGGGGCGIASIAGRIGAGNGGNAGGSVRAVIDVSGIGTATITIGAGGTGGVYASPDGVAGGDTTWADGTSTIVASGGLGGGYESNASAVFAVFDNSFNSANSITSGANYVGTLVNKYGGVGTGCFAPSTSLVFSGRGGSNEAGDGGRPRSRTSHGKVAGQDGTGYGSGGSGSVSINTVGSDPTAEDGGAGADGVVFITEFAG